MSGSVAATAADDGATPLLTALIAVVFGTTLIFGYLWPLGFSGLATFAGVACMPALARARPPMRLIWPLLALVIWALISLRWSTAAVDPHTLRKYASVEKLTAGKLLMQLALYGSMVVGTRRLSERGATLGLTVLGVVTGLLGLVILVDAGLGAAIYLRLAALLRLHIDIGIARRNITQGEYAIVLFVWCVSVHLYQRGRRAMILLLFAPVVAASLILSEADAALAALTLGLAAFVMVWRLGSRGVRALAALTTVYWLGAPLFFLASTRWGIAAAIYPHVRRSWSQRLDIWSFSAGTIAEKPLLGWGLDASRNFGKSIPLHTHDASLQVWLELGVVGAVLAAAFWIGLWVVVERWSRRDPAAAGAAASTAVAYLTIGAVSFGVWQEWWLALGAIAIVALTCLRRSRLTLASSAALRPSAATRLSPASPR